MASLRLQGVGGQTALRLSLPRDQVLTLNRDLMVQLTPALSRPLSAKETDLRTKLVNGELLTQENLEWAQRQIERHQSIGAEVYSFYDKRYPPLLRLIPTPPPIIYALGDLTPLASPLITVAGTRRPSMDGRRRAEGSLSLIADLSTVGVVSGLALGIDKIAHQGALARGRYTAAIIGNGLGRCYPESNQTLSDAIVESGGAILSERPFHSPPTASALIARDRLQSGLTAVTYIVESGPRGGSLHTARAALQQQRALWIPRSLRTILSELQSREVSWLTSSAHLSEQLEGLADLHRLLLDQAQRLYVSLSIASEQEERGHPQLSLF